jgi:hypothetical protein
MYKIDEQTRMINIIVISLLPFGSVCAWKNLKQGPLRGKELNRATQLGGPDAGNYGSPATTPGAKQPGCKVTAHLLPFSRLRMNGAIPPFYQVLSWRGT